MSHFNLGNMGRMMSAKGSKVSLRGKKPSHAATFAEIRAEIESSYITAAEARCLSLCAIRRSRDWQKPADKGDPALYRQEPLEPSLLEGINVLPDEVDV